MENALLIGLTRQMTLRRDLDVTANNIANMSTAGFKLERALFAEEEAARPARAADGGRVAFVRDIGLARDFAPGALEHTGRTFDVALESDGFFAVDADGATRYTRDGRFALDAQGQLVTAAGAPVLSDTGTPITIPAVAASTTITPEGAVMVDGASVGRLQVVRFDNLAALDKAGDGTFATDAAASPVDQPDVRQGYVEKSNVNPIAEITRLIDVTRAYESVTKMLSTDEDLKRRAIDKLAGVR